MQKYQNLIIFLLLCFGIETLIQPTQFSQQLRNIIPKQITLLHQDLGRTVNGYNIMAYGLTAIPGISQKYQLKDFSYYPSSVIISYMHSTDQNSVNLLFSYAVNIIKSYENDYYMETVLKTGFIWLVPYLSIDAFEFFKKNNYQKDQPKNSQQNGKAKNKSQIKLTMKNMNKYPNKNQQINCETKFNDKFSGVNLNYNFLQQYGQQFKDICNDNYAGPNPFSERQALALKNLFNTLTITAVIDLQSGQNEWVFPSKLIWNQKHNYSYLYKDIIEKISKKSHYKSVEQTQTNLTTKQKSISGGFINWASLHGSLAFKFLITSQKSPQILQKTAGQAFAVMDLILKKNAPVYNKYRSEDKKTLFVQSISLNQFTVQLQIIIQFGQTVTKNYVIPKGQIVALSLQPPISTDGLSNSYRAQPKYHLYVLNSLIAEVLDIDSIILVSALPPEAISSIKIQQTNPTEKQNKIFTLEIVIAVSMLSIGAIVVLVLGYLIKTKGHKGHKIHKKSYQLISGEIDDSKQSKNYLQ